MIGIIRQIGNVLCCGGLTIVVDGFLRTGTMVVIIGSTMLVLGVSFILYIELGK